MNELELAIIACLYLGGANEVTQPYQVGYDLNRIRVDCQTDTHVVEIGLDKRSSLDSVHQSLFASHVTGLKPKVLIIDRDGREDRFQYQVKSVANLAGVEYAAISDDFLIRWQMTSYLRSAAKSRATN